MGIKVAYYGGTFDPIHNGHIKIIRYLLINGFDKVIIVPTGQNPLKNNKPIASYQNRVNMIRLAINNIPNIEILLTENKQTNNYTYNTLLELKKKYSNITLVLGTDIENDINKWYNYKKIWEMFDILWINRGSNHQNAIKIHNLPNVSSTEIRQGKKWHLLNKKVLQYIHNNALYFKQIIKYFTNDENRVIHSINVANKAKELAYNNNLDINKAYIAGYLHDIAKYMDKEYIQEIMGKYFNKHLNENWRTYHAFVGSYIVQKKLLIQDNDIINSIKFHTTGTGKEMTLFNIIIFLADKISHERQYENVEKIRYIANNDIIKAYKYIIQNNYKRFNSSKGLLLNTAYSYWLRSNEELN